MAGGATPPSSAFDPKREDAKDFVLTYEALLTLCGPGAADRREETRKGLRDLIRTRPKLISAHAMLATLAMKDGRPAEAIGYCESIVAILAASKESSPIPAGAGDLTAGQFDTRDLARAHFNCGLVLKELGRISEAASQYEQALRIRTEYADAHLNLGALAQQAGRGPEAVAHYEQALRIKPDYPEAHGNLAITLHRMGKLPEAIGHYEQAVRLKPDYAQNNPAFASALASARETAAAMERYQKILL
ncbi:MAG: tetratricopeptide repeat protein, partial [Planctomycetota bacterium]|nr:tetratricopeptide repeat protein [Planctomycetota bacterium]